MKNSVEGNSNNLANRDINIYQSNATQQESDFGVINDIFNFVIENAKSVSTKESTKGLTSDKLIHINDKIKINFTQKEEIKEVQEYFTALYSKIFLVEKSFQTLLETDQVDVHFYISSRYKDLKRENKPSIEILKKLTEYFIPPLQINNPSYNSISQAIVLFFFDDCTIFEKTIKEQGTQINLFESL